MKYDHNKTDKKWQKYWTKNKYQLWKASDNSKKKKMYILDMFPYPSGLGLHVGHVEGYTGTDILSRYYRSKGYNVLHPMGWDAFGLPAEVYALQHNIHPRQAVKENVKNFRSQLEMMGFSYDWNRLIDTTEPEYFKWTQWTFLKMFEKGLAYEAEMPVNFCPSCQAVLADEEAEGNKCFRCGSDIERKSITQWMLRITDYAERLLKDLDMLDWPEQIKTMQRNWIGRSEGYEVSFKTEDDEEVITVFTTRLDTLFGVSALVISPENPILNKIITKEHTKEVKEYISKATQKSDLERQFLAKEKTGVFTGAYVINPANYEKVPVWVSDYVLMTYGTGAVMSVPAHDERDFEFSKKYNLKVTKVIRGDQEKENCAYEGEGVLINSGPFNNTPSEIARDKIAIFVGAKKKINYKLRDWIFSRQRFWGEPIPIIKCPKCGNVPLKEKDLPLKLPEIKSYKTGQNGESPLANIKSWVNVKCPKCGGKATRETNTMPQWAGSCWYFLRFLDPKNKKSLIEKNKEKYWMPVDYYIGGKEHAVTHLIYSRFWFKFLYDIGLVSEKEPFKKLINQGLVLGDDGEKMSKSLGNVVNPEEVAKEYGVDTLRMYEMFMGGFEDAKPWNTSNIMGIKRFLEKVWNLCLLQSQSKKDKSSGIKKTNQENKDFTEKLDVLKHKTIKKVSNDIEEMRFNTAISALMEYTNFIQEGVSNNFKIDFEFYKVLVVMLSPFAPFVTEEIWQVLFKYSSSVQKVVWPEFKEEKTIDKNVTIAIQINGKLRGTIDVDKDASQDIVTKLALNLPKVQNHMPDGAKIKKVVFVPNKMINFVI